MTPIEAVFFYGSPPGEAEMRAVHEVREVYGIRQIVVDRNAHSCRIEYDASRLAAEDVAAILRDAGIDLCDPLVAFFVASSSKLHARQKQQCVPTVA